ncbi:MAG: hypothetical protein AAF404_13760 [Pseudomonadota bacterium]
MSHQNDSSFFKTFGVVLGALVVFTVFIIVMANMFSPASDAMADPLVAAQQQERIMPVGQSRIAK